jgi:hypothetical protein
MKYTFGSKIKYQTIFNIKDELIVSFFIKNIIFTCGHCLPEQISFDDANLTLLYTSGFDNLDEGLELGIIKIIDDTNTTLINPFDIKLTLKELSFYYDENIYLIHDNIKYHCDYLFTFDQYKFTQLKQFEINCVDISNYILFFDHQITKLTLNKKFLNLIEMNKIILYKSNYHYKDIELKHYDKIKKILSKNGICDFQIKTKYFNYLTKPSFSGSPLINNNNIFIGYHIGSTFGFIYDKSTNEVCWIGNIGYCRCVNF